VALRQDPGMEWFARVGLVVTILGIVCGLFAYGTTLQEYDPPVVKSWPRFMNAFRRLSIRIGTLLAGPRPQVIRPAGIASEAGFGKPTLRVGDIEVPDNIPLAEQVRLLVRRIEHLEAVVGTDRQQAQKLHETLRAELVAHVERLEAGNARKRAPRAACLSAPFDCRWRASSSSASAPSP
jgi:hypothetical protein